MKKVVPVIAWLAASLGTVPSAQAQIKLVSDSSFRAGQIPCGFSSHLFAPGGRSGTGTPQPIYRSFLSPVIPVNQWTGPVYTSCSSPKFALYFEDDLTGNGNYGFNEGNGIGVQRKATFCAVLAYLESVFDCSNVSASNPVRIYVHRSFSAGNAAPPTTLSYGEGSPVIDPAEPAPVHGRLYQYLKTGTDANPNDYHAEIQVNFDQVYLQHPLNTQPIMLNYQNTTALPGKCELDLYSVLLHGMGHALGWASSIGTNTNNPTLLPGVPRTALDEAIYAGSPVNAGAMSKLISGGAINTAAVPNSQHYWLGNAPAPYNIPLYSGSQYASAGYAQYPDLYFSELDDQLGTYSLRTRVSPGDISYFVMTPFRTKGTARRQFTKEELLSFSTVLGLDLNPAYTTSHPELQQNHKPYSVKMSTALESYYRFMGWVGYPSIVTGPDNIPPDVTVVNDLRPGNLPTTVTVNISGDADNRDDDGDIIKVAAGTLVNFRGCGKIDANGSGNNHDMLAVAPDRQSITYTIPHNFYGLAQFGVNLTDDKEQGAFVIYTIKVDRGSNVSVPPSGELVLNGDFESGTEVKRAGGAEELIPNAAFDEDYLHEGRLFGAHFADCHPFDVFTNLLGVGGSGVGIRHAGAGCLPGTFSTATIATQGFGAETNSINNANVFGVTVPRFMSVYEQYTQNRYQMLSKTAYYNLAGNLEPCQRYKLVFQTIDAPLPVISFTGDNTVQFANTDFSNFTTRPLNYTVSSPVSATTVNFPNPYGPGTLGWQEKTVIFDYCANVPSHILALAAAAPTPIDNISLVKVPIPNLSATASASNLNNPCPSILSADLQNAACSSQVTYVWSPAAGLSCTTCAHPEAYPVAGAQTYTVTATDCRGQTASASVTVAQKVPVATGVCCDAAVIANPTTVFLRSSNTVNNGNELAGKASAILTVNPNPNLGLGTAPIANTSIAIHTSSFIVIDGTLEIDKDLIFYQCPNVLFTPNSRILLTGGHYLTINGCTLRSICTGMWDGIESSYASAPLTITGSVLQDMINGVQVGNGAVLICTGNTFRDNLTGIKFYNTPATVSYTVLPSYNGQVFGNTFRTTGAGLMAPHTGEKGRYGIYIDQSQRVNIGDQANAANGNTFDNLRTGIYVNFYRTGPSSFSNFAAKIGIYNNQFQNITGGNYGMPYSGNSGSVSVYEDPDGTAVFGKSAGVIGADNVIDMASSSLASGQVVNCTKAITTSNISTNVKSIQMSGLTWGISLANNTNATHWISGNYLVGPQFGVQLVSPTQPRVEYNTIDLNASYTGSFNGAPLGTPIAIQSAGGTIADINENTINIPGYTAVGINLSSATNGEVKRNQIVLTNATANISGSATQNDKALYGISASSCTGVNIAGNHVDGTPATNIATTRTKVAGLYLYNSPYLRLECNHLSSLKYGFLVVSSCQADVLSVAGNTFSTHGYGMLFRHLGNEGTLGNIGNANNDNNNNFTGSTYLSGARIYRLSACAATLNDRIYTSIANLTSAQSQGNNSNCNYGVFGNSAPITVHPSCPSLGLPIAPPPAPPVITDIAHAEEVARGQVAYPEYEAIAGWVDQYRLYELLKVDTAARSASPVLDSFYVAINDMPMSDVEAWNAQLQALADATAGNNAAAWQALLDSLGSINDAMVPEELNEKNEQRINEIYLHYLAAGLDALTGEELDAIRDMALSCPYVAGTAVYKARTLYALYSTPLVYDDLDVCNAAGVYKGGSGGRFDGENAFLAGPGSEGRFAVFPNPASSSLNIRYSQGGVLELTDMLGRVLKTVTLPDGAKQQQADVSSLVPGVYLYRHLQQGRFLDAGKITIVQ